MQSDAFEWFWNRVVVSSQGDVSDYGTGISDNDTKYPRR
jgi:hypothetical protein